MEDSTLLGLLAGTMTTMAYFPQLVKTWQSKSADDLSWSMLIVLCLGILLWLVYGASVQDIPVICANVLTLVLSSTILGLKIHYRLRRASVDP